MSKIKDEDAVEKLLDQLDRPARFARMRQFAPSAAAMYLVECVQNLVDVVKYQQAKIKSLEGQVQTLQPPLDE